MGSEDTRCRPGQRHCRFLLPACADVDDACPSTWHRLRETGEAARDDEDGKYHTHTTTLLSTPNTTRLTLTHTNSDGIEGYRLLEGDLHIFRCGVFGGPYHCVPM